MANSIGSRPSDSGLFGASTPTFPTPSRPSAPSLFGGSTSTTPTINSSASAISGPAPGTPPLHLSSGSDEQRKLSFADAFITYHPRRSGAYADFTIVCSGQEFKVHRIILVAHSEYFKRLFDGRFREAGEQKVTLQDDSLAAVERMIGYCYNFHLSVSRQDPSTYLHSCSVMFAMADKYDMPGMKELALENFQFWAQVDGSLYHINGKSADAPSLATAMMKAVPHIYQNTPATDDRLRTFVSHRFLQNDKELLKHCEKKAFDEMLLEVPEFACDLIPALTGIRMKVADDKRFEWEAK